MSSARSLVLSNRLDRQFIITIVMQTNFALILIAVPQPRASSAQLKLRSNFIQDIEIAWHARVDRYPAYQSAK